MSKVRVQCPGSGVNINAGMNAKRATCPRCHTQQDVVPSNGRMRKHMRLTTTKNLKANKA